MASFQLQLHHGQFQRQLRDGREFYLTASEGEDVDDFNEFVIIDSAKFRKLLVGFGPFDGNRESWIYPRQKHARE